MRDRLYHGKRKDTGKWVEGYFLETFHPTHKVFIIESIDISASKSGMTIYDSRIYEVFPETVGQDTGLTDKHCKRIYEGSIVNAAIETEFCDEQGYRAEIKTITGVVQWDRFSACWMIRGIEYGHKAFCDMLSTEEHLFEVIGNTYDNPELLEADNE